MLSLSTVCSFSFRTGISSGGLSSSVKPTNWEIFWAGCAGGAAQLVVACPVDLAKIKLQVQTQTATTGEEHSVPILNGDRLNEIGMVL